MPASLARSGWAYWRPATWCGRHNQRKKTPMAKQTQTKAPTHEIFHVVGDDDKARWTKIGVGWQHQDKDGLNLAINYTPLVEGRTVVRKIKPKQEAA